MNPTLTRMTGDYTTIPRPRECSRLGQRETQKGDKSREGEAEI